MTLIGELFSDAIDVVGDVHAEVDALERLLGKLGYDEAVKKGTHLFSRHQQSGPGGRGK